MKFTLSSTLLEIFYHTLAQMLAGYCDTNFDIQDTQFPLLLQTLVTSNRRSLNASSGTSSRKASATRAETRWTDIPPRLRTAQRSWGLGSPCRGHSETSSSGELWTVVHHIASWSFRDSVLRFVYLISTSFGIKCSISHNVSFQSFR